MAGTCKFCGCTNNQPCDPPCAWADEAMTICSTCAGAAEFVGYLVELFRTLPSSDLNADLTTAFAAQPLEAQQKLVMAARHMADAILQAQADEHLAMTDMVRLGAFLAERHPERWNPSVGATGASPVDVVLEILGDRRIVLAR